jgi:hypothetical protein
MELLEELPEPTSCSHAVGHDAIVSLGARARDDVLMLEGPRDEVIAEERIIAQGGPASIWATHQVRIHVDRQLRGGGGASQV